MPTARPVKRLATLKLIAAAALLAAGGWAYSGTLLELYRTWMTVSDYAHGLLVFPFALAILWLRRSTFPGIAASSPLLGVLFLAGSLGLRYAGGRYFFNFMDGWSLLPWLLALAAFLGGRPLMRWCLPAIGFLIFMVPLPFRIETQLSAPLQRLATQASTTALQCLGQPAFAEGNVILLGDDRLEVAEACCGLRLFMTVVALSYFFIAVRRAPWWESSLIGLATIPIAILSNATRIVATGLLYQWTADEAIRRQAHDVAGWGMMLLAGCQFVLLAWFLKSLFPEEQEPDMAILVRHAQI